MNNQKAIEILEKALATNSYKIKNTSITILPSEFIIQLFQLLGKESVYSVNNEVNAIESNGKIYFLKKCERHDRFVHEFDYSLSYGIGDRFIYKGESYEVINIGWTK